VIIVEDIVDSGLTLSYLRKGLLAREPASLEVCALMVKVANSAPRSPCGTWVSDPSRLRRRYGLDVAEQYRNLGEIRILNEEPR